jgi:squalene-hopene/tetraprenyl-beta-curcumene cyclase
MPITPQWPRRGHSETGGIKCRVFTKSFSRSFGEFAWFGVPSMPIELSLVPSWAYFNIRILQLVAATIIPLSIVMAVARSQVAAKRTGTGTVCASTGPSTIPLPRKKVSTLKNFFIGVDHLLKIYESSLV